MLYVLTALLLLGVLIILHEGGHFWAARLCGIEVREFSAGMGPLLLQRRSRKGTQFSVRALPIGGYCAFYGEDEDSDDPRAFNLQPVWKRAVTVAAGPLMNFVAAFAVIVIYLSLVGIPAIVPEVESVENVAAEAGLQSGDRILAVNGEELSDTQAIATAIAGSEGKAVTLTVERGGEKMDLALTPFYDEALSRWRVGFTFAQRRTRVSLLTSIPFSVQYNAESATLIVKTLKDLIFHGQGVEDVTGPVGTVYVIQEVTREGGLDIYLELMAIISVNLGLMNLLPIPGLDGSRLLFLLAEAIRRKPVNRDIEGTIHTIGFALLMGLMVVLTYKDIMQYFLK